MFSSTDRIFGPHAAALGLWGSRNEILASNIANSDTPGYKARDMDFKSVLAGTASPSLRMLTTNERHITPPGTAMGEGDLLYRVPNQPSLDGNTVETDVEQSEFASNALRYQASLRFINGRVSTLRAAIAGGHQ
ncbi:MAG: flagellar basal body rod protein FlgB [Gammaproteobacteria bacterium]